MQATATVSRTPTRKPWTAEDHDEATTKAETISMRVYGLASVLRVFAFAAEARKALVSLEAAFEHRPKVRDDLHNHAHLANWKEMPDSSSDALEFIAQEMAAAMEEGVNLVYGLAHRLTDQEQASSKTSSQ